MPLADALKNVILVCLFVALAHLYLRTFASQRTQHPYEVARNHPVPPAEVPKNITGAPSDDLDFEVTHAAAGADVSGDDDLASYVFGGSDTPPEAPCVSRADESPAQGEVTACAFGAFLEDGGGGDQAKDGILSGFDASTQTFSRA